MKDGAMLQRLTDLHIISDLGMYYCGKRINTQNHIYGPEIRNHYLFVLVNKGDSVLHSHGNTTFGEHDLLIMQPNEKIHYKALNEWSISWLGLYGSAVDEFVHLLGVTPEKPLLHISLYNELKAVMDNIYEASKDTSLSSKLLVAGMIYEFFGILFKDLALKPQTEIVDAALRIIEYSFCENITVEQIAEHLSVNSAYFSRKFTDKTGISPKRYILNKRIERAKELLRTSSASIMEISNSVGYEDQFYFCRIFKKYTGVTPGTYRVEHI